MNFIEIRAFGQMRSGNHAIIQWLLDQHSGHPCCFLNNVRHGDVDPYTNYAQRVLAGIPEDIETEKLRALDKRLLVYSYEDQGGAAADGPDFLGSVFSPVFETRRADYLGPSEHRYDLAIIRDPFNFFASRIQFIRTRGGWGGIKDLDDIRHDWKKIARFALETERGADPQRLAVKFNQWAVDDTYRRHTSERLMGSFSDETMGIVSNFGGGSSFQASPLTLTRAVRRWRKLLDPKTYTRIGHYARRLVAPPLKTQSLFERWAAFSDDADYRSVFRDEEVLQLSEALFGEIPGTREFVRSVRT
jgi:hypothetical protein